MMEIKKISLYIKKMGILSESAITILHLNSHEIFIKGTFMQVHSIRWNPHPLLRIKPGRARQFFNRLSVES
jgi:hypothetical protein